MNPPYWTNEEDAQLIDLFTEGLSYSKIGRRLGRTKNAIVGRVYRLRRNGCLTKSPHVAVFTEEDEDEIIVDVPAFNEPSAPRRFTGPISPPISGIALSLSLRLELGRTEEPELNGCHFPVEQRTDGSWLRCNETRTTSSRVYCKTHYELCCRKSKWKA